MSVKRKGGEVKGERVKLGEGAREDSRPYDQLTPAVLVGVQMLRLVLPVMARNKA